MALVVNARGPTTTHTNLDIPEARVLFGLEAVVDGCGCERHVLLQRVEGSLWICLDTSLDVANYDVQERNEIFPFVLFRQFPIEGRPFLSLVPIDAVAMENFRARARQHITMLGGGLLAFAPTADARLFFRDTAPPRFSMRVPLNAANSRKFCRKKYRGRVVTWLALLCTVILIFSILPGAFAAPSCLVAPQAPEEALSYSWTNGVNLAADLGLDDFTFLTPPCARFFRARVEKSVFFYFRRSFYWTLSGLQRCTSSPLSSECKTEDSAVSQWILAAPSIHAECLRHSGVLFALFVTTITCRCT